MALFAAVLCWWVISENLDNLQSRNDSALSEAEFELSVALAQQRMVVLSIGTNLELRVIRAGLLSSNTDFDRTALEQLFTEFLAPYPNIANISWIDEDGIVRVSVNQRILDSGESLATSADQPQDHYDHRTFLAALDLQGRDYFVSDPELDRQNGKIVFPIQPILRSAQLTSTMPDMRNGVLAFKFNVKGLVLQLLPLQQKQRVFIDLLDGTSGKIYASSYRPDLAWAHELKDPPVYYGDIYPDRFEQIGEFLSTGDSSRSLENALLLSASPKNKITQAALVAYLFIPPGDIIAAKRDIVLRTMGLALILLFIGCLFLLQVFRMEKKNVETMQTVLDLSAAKSQFLANMSHEIRTPITGMIGMLDLLEAEIQNPDQKEKLQFIQQCTSTLRRVIDDILDISKLQGGSVVLESKPFCPALTVERGAKLYRAVASLSGTQITTTIPTELSALAVDGDEHRLSQVLNNLVSNAVKFTGHGRVTVQMLQLYRSGLNVTLRFSVSDTGIGMPDDAIQTLGQPFMQADVSTTRTYGGTGLGLSICKNLLALMNSELVIESEPGKGSTFSFDLTFNLSQVEVAQRGTPCPAEPSEERTAGGSVSPSRDPDNVVTRQTLMQRLARVVEEHGPPRVLVAEDSFAMQVLIREIFKSFSIPVEFADNGKVALERLDEQPFDLVFMDLQMPEMGGIEATGIIRQKWTPAQLPIIVLSAVTQAEEITRALDAGGDKCLSKPIDIEELLATLLHYWNPQPA
jgi:signal transduction histidine kinase/CheY-like chemotaxis protein